VVYDADHEREIVLLTHLICTAIVPSTKSRWQIEQFFKALKQNLTVKAFVGTSENALRQIWTALIALRLLNWLLSSTSFLLIAN
jgi:hypothetical protein